MAFGEIKEGSSLVKNYCKSLGTIVAFLSEVKVCRSAAEHNASFVRPYENSKHDCGLYFGPADLTLPQILMRRLVEVMKHEEGRIVGIEVKEVMPSARSSHPSTQVWNFTFKSEQSEYRAVIASTAEDPEYIGCLRGRQSWSRSCYLSPGWVKGCAFYKLSSMVLRINGNNDAQM